MNTVGSAFVSAMEDVLDLYAEPFDPQYPQVCVDERPTQLISEVQQPIPATPGQPERYDYEYRREGTANLFALFQPLAGWRHIEVTAQRTKVDFAKILKDLADVHFPQAARIRLVTDNLNIHHLAVLYDAFPPEEANRLAHKFEFHYTPKHASWLNMVEIELSVLARQCLDRRIGDIETLKREIAAWAQARNAAQATVDWQFTSATARTKLAHLYPSI